MTPHDQEVRLYNAIMGRIEQISKEAEKLHSRRDELAMVKDVENGVFLVAVWALDLKEKFHKYSNRHYE